MKLPNYEEAVIPQRKITEYLLSPVHRYGSSKAEFFTAFGFSVDEWETFANALLRHAADYDISKTEDLPFGARYIIDGVIYTPDGRNPFIRTVWFIETEEKIPHLVTAHPLPRRNK